MGNLLGMELSTKTTERLHVILPILSFLTMLMAVYITYSAWNYRSGWDAAVAATNASQLAKCGFVSDFNWSVP